MKKFTASALALVAGLSISAPALAQQTFERQGGESATQMANRIGACGGAGITSARFTGAGSVLRVTCAGGAGNTDLTGGLGAGAAVAGGVALVAIAAAAIGGGSGTSSTTSTTSTTGTN